jgi:uncharacterized protein YcfJ
MKPSLSVGAIPFVLALSLAFNSGCANKTRTGALVGTGVGTGVGAIIGHQIGKGKEGAMIGAAVGAASGALIGRKQDVEDENAAVARNVAHMEEERQATRRAMSNFDVAEMANSHISDAIIINTIQDRGGAFDTSPTGIISLKKDGVSDTVIMAMQRHNKTR